MAADDKDVTLLAEFEDITTTAINMPGCKAVMYFTDRAGNEHSTPLHEVTRVEIVSEGSRRKQPSKGKIATGRGSVYVS